jgi:predicted O-methyltransferase YrrM
LLESENHIFVRDYPPGHFYSPIPDLREFRRRASASPGVETVNLGGIDLREESQFALIGTLAGYYSELPFQAAKRKGLRYHLDNPFFSFGDGVILYSLLRHLRPRRIVEIGSGYSSAEMLDISDRFFGSSVDFTFVEPHPERLYGLLSAADRLKCRIEEKPVQDVSQQVFDRLGENDILFVDSSHVAKTYSDLLHILFKVLPNLQRGVVVHFHDVPWPFEYPRRWVEGGRAWNEAYFLRAFLQYNSAFEIVYFNDFVAQRRSARLAQEMPLSVQPSSFADTVTNTSLWLRKIQ